MPGCSEHHIVFLAFRNEFNKFNYIRAQMQDSIYHMTLNSHFIQDISTLVKLTLLRTSVHYVRLNPLVDYRNLMHGFISLLDA